MPGRRARADQLAVSARPGQDRGRGGPGEGRARNLPLRADAATALRLVLPLRAARAGAVQPGSAAPHRVRPGQLNRTGENRRGGEFACATLAPRELEGRRETRDDGPHRALNGARLRDAAGLSAPAAPPALADPRRDADLRRDRLRDLEPAAAELH